jgi:hypothetical protein
LLSVFLATIEWVNTASNQRVNKKTILWEIQRGTLTDDETQEHLKTLHSDKT